MADLRVARPSGSSTSTAGTARANPAARASRPVRSRALPAVVRGGSSQRPVQTSRPTTTCGQLAARCHPPRRSSPGPVREGRGAKEQPASPGAQGPDRPRTTRAAAADRSRRRARPQRARGPGRRGQPASSTAAAPATSTATAGRGCGLGRTNRPGSCFMLVLRPEPGVGLTRPGGDPGGPPDAGSGGRSGPSPRRTGTARLPAPRRPGPDRVPSGRAPGPRRRPRRAPATPGRLGRSRQRTSTGPRAAAARGRSGAQLVQAGAGAGQTTTRCFSRRGAARRRAGPRGRPC